nr:MAG TPA: hypothetical protein [Caudoviricetes sp.]
MSFRFVSFSCVPLLRLWLFDCFVNCSLEL